MWFTLLFIWQICCSLRKPDRLRSFSRGRKFIRKVHYLESIKIHMASSEEAVKNESSSVQPSNNSSETSKPTQQVVTNPSNNTGSSKVREMIILQHTFLFEDLQFVLAIEALLKISGREGCHIELN